MEINNGSGCAAIFQNIRVFSTNQCLLIGSALAIIGGVGYFLNLTAPITASILIGGTVFAAIGILHKVIQFTTSSRSQANESRASSSQPLSKEEVQLSDIPKSSSFLQLFRDAQVIQSISFDLKNSEQLTEEFTGIPFRKTRNNDNANCTPFNRYKNVTPYPTNQYRMRDPCNQKICPYINASEFKTGHILTQGPISDTIFHFWLMVWDSNAEQIVMTTDCHEAWNKKCEQYWPPDDKQGLTTGNFIIQLISEKMNDNHTIIRKFKVIRETEENVERIISQIQITGWQDHRSFGLKELRRAVELGQQNIDAPQIIHCSAGIGRSGTYLCCDLIYKLLPHLNDNESIDIKKLVEYVRSSPSGRAGCVQTLGQYKLIHDFYQLLLSERLHRRAV